MYYLLVYDIDSKDIKKNKLSKVAKVCEDYGIRVQNSVFELNIGPKELLTLTNKLEKIINPLTDSIRIYELGKKYNDKIILLGKKESFELTIDNGFFL